MSYVLIITDKMFPDGDCKIYSSDLNSLRKKGYENIEVDPQNIEAKIYECDFGIGDLIVDCNSVINKR